MVKPFLFERGFTPSDPHSLLGSAVIRRFGNRVNFFFFFSPSFTFFILRSPFLVLVLTLGSPFLLLVLVPRLGSLSTEQYLETLTLLQ